MKLVVFCLFAAWCVSSASTSTHQTDTLHKKKLQEVLRHLKKVKESLQHNDKMLNTPPMNVEDCCCRSALQCFRANLHVKFNVTTRNQGKLYHSLTSPITEGGLCGSSRSENVQSTCQDCDSHPKENVREFFNRLESLIQKGITRLTTN